MSNYRFVISRLLLLWVLGILGACGSGDESSNLLFEPERVEEDTGTQVTVFMTEGQQIIPVGSNSTVLILTTFEDFDTETQTISDVPVLPHVPFTVSVTGDATLNGGQKSIDISTDSRGQASFKINYPPGKHGNPLCSIAGRDRYEGGTTFPVFFGGSVEAEIVGADTAQADGKTGVEILVTARDGNRTPISGAYVDFSFSPGAFAVVAPPTQTTDESDEGFAPYTNVNGELNAIIANTVPQTDVFVTPIVEGLAVNPPLRMHFTGDDVISTSDPQTLDLIVKANNVFADGESEATLVVVARDEAGVPIRNVPVNIASDSATATLRIGNDSNILSITGNTGTEGRFELNMTDRVEENITVTATTSTGETTLSTQQTIAFTNQVTGGSVARIQLDEPIDNGQPANGQDAVTLRGIVFDKQDNLVSNQTVSILVSGGSATLNPDVVTTDVSGRFSTTITDTVVESFSAWATVGKVKSDPVTVRFESETSTETRPRSITLFAVPDTESIGHNLVVNAVVRDGSGTPMSGVRLFISASGNTANTAVFSSGDETSDGGGNASFTVSNTVPGTFNVTVRAVDKDGKALGVQSNSQRLEFTSSITEVEELIVTVVENNKPANGSDAVQVDLIARDRNGRAVSNVPIAIRMSTGATAIANPAQLVTDGNGTASTQITSTRAGTVALTFEVEEGRLVKPPSPVRITFTASSGTASLEKVDMDIKDSPQPADGQSAITVVVIPLDDNDTPIANANVELIVNSPNVTGSLTGTTNALGEFHTTLTSTVPEENIKITAVVTLNAQINKDSSNTITFTPLGGAVADLAISLIGDNQLANNTDAITIVAVARDEQNRVVEGAPIFITMPKGTRATATPSNGATDHDGVFSASITSVQAGEIPVTLAVDSPSGLSETITVHFKSGEAGASTILDRIDLLVENSPQMADGQATVNLTAVPYGTQNGERTPPLANINMELIGEPEGLTFTPGTTGKTNSLGKYPVTITSTVAGVYTITPLAWKDNDDNNKFVGNATTIEFKPRGTRVKDLSVDVVNDNQPISQTIRIAVVARDEGGIGAENIPILVRIDSGAKASADPTRGFTDANGFFETNISATEAGTVAVSISVENTDITHPPVSVTFIPGDDISVASTELLLADAPQPADGTSEVTLIVKAFDDRGETLPNKPVELITDSDQITIAGATGTTNALGEYRTKATTTVPGTYNVTPIADGVQGETVPVTFTPVEIPIPDTITLTVTGSNQAVGQEATLTVLARDDAGLPVKAVPIVIHVDPSDESPDVTGSVIFGGGGFKGTTGDNGVFETTVKNTRPGTFKVTAFVDGTSLSSGTELVTFIGDPSDDPDVATIELLVNSPQLKSEGWRTDSTEAVIITAILRNEDNNLIQNATVNFEVNSGEIQPVQIVGDTQTPLAQAVSDAEGRAYARLTTRGNPDNRIITVKATVVSTDPEPPEDTVVVEVIGTTLSINGPTSITTGDSAELEILLLDSSGEGIDGREIRVESALGNVFDNTAPITNASGRATVNLTASVPGQETVTATKENVSPATLSLAVSDDHFTLRAVDGVAEIPLGQTKTFIVSWSTGGVPQVNQRINLSITRGELSNNNILTDFNGEATFNIRAVDLGPGVITASVPNGPSAQLNIRFIATRADSMVLQATPSTIGVNDQGTETQTSQITAVVRLENNLVPGIRVNFALNDPTGGRLSAPFKITDESGRASVQYIAGSAPSASNGVVVTATVEGVDGLECRGTESANGGCVTRLTVALKQMFIKLGTGNEIEDHGITTYRLPYTVLVSDITGAPIQEAEVILSVIPISYGRGEHFWDANATAWVQLTTIVCPNEDVNLNGILDPGEDINQSGQIEPGGVVTFVADQDSTVENNTVKVKTNNEGFANFGLIYAKQYAHWVEIQLEARVEVSGSEDTDADTFRLGGIASDYTSEDSAPPGQRSPFGLGVVQTGQDANGDPIYSEPSCAIRN